MTAREVVFPLACMVLLALPAWAANESPSAARYAEQVAKAEQGDATADYTALRLSYALTPDYDPYGGTTQPLLHDAWNTLQTKDCKTALAKTAELLKHDYTSLDAHFIRSECFKQAGDAPRFDRELAIGRGLADALLHSGDGKTENTAYVVVTLSEENFVLGYLHITEKQQALLSGKNGRPYDLLTGTTENGEKIGVLFDVSRLMAAMERELKK